MKTRDFLITSENGLHARPATILVQTASNFSSEINLIYKNKSVNFKSIMGVMSLGVGRNEKVTVTTNGNDETDAMNAIIETMKKEKLI